MTRRKDQKRARMLRTDFSPGDQHLLFLAGHRAGGHPHRPTLRAGHGLLQEIGKFAIPLRLPITNTRSRGAPISRKRAASAGVCAKTASTWSKTLRIKNLNRRYPRNERSERRAFTKTTLAPA